MFSFEVVHQHRQSSARLGLINTPHGVVHTPVFMPVGTRGTVKGLLPKDILATHTQIILANTYHLLLRPGPDVVESLGGLHDMMSWPRPILTDSGGFQVFSLASLASLDDDHVVFQSHIDGRRFVLDPETALRTQHQLGADIIMPLDQCPSIPSPPQELKQAVSRTIRWAKISKALHDNPQQALFGIVQGGTDLQLRSNCAEALCELDFPGYAIGGLSVGESHDEMVTVLNHLVPILPRTRPRYLMGVGMPKDLYEAVRIGVDMFDCVLPTRNGRNAYAFTAHGPLRLRNEKHKTSNEPLEPGCDCYACTHFSRGYIRHLFIVDEMLGPILTSLHNIRFFERLMARMRSLIKQDEPLETIAHEYPVVLE